MTSYDEYVAIVTIGDIDVQRRTRANEHSATMTGDTLTPWLICGILRQWYYGAIHSLFDHRGDRTPPTVDDDDVLNDV